MPDFRGAKPITKLRLQRLFGVAVLGSRTICPPHELRAIAFQAWPAFRNGVFQEATTHR